MKVLVKKEIRLLLPAWIVAVLLAMVQAVTRPIDFYVVSLLFFGLTIMALTAIGRETSLNTFSSLLAQPAERIRIWQVKLAVLAAAFLVVLIVWLAALGIAHLKPSLDEPDRETSFNLVIAVCLVAAATFTGGLWTTLLLRQLAGAFWLTVLVPATLGFAGIFLVNSQSENVAVAVLSLILGTYSIAGFLFARWLYFRAQDIGWSGGVIALPEWRFLSASARTGEEVRTHRPVVALLKKELLLQQGVLTGAAGIFALHLGVVLLRVVHHFPSDSAGEALTSIVWVSWLVLPALLGSIAVADERKTGVMESQLTLPASRRTQFVVKFLVTLGLGVFLGGVMPALLERAGMALGATNPIFQSPKHLHDGIPWTIFTLACSCSAAWFTLVSFFASSLAKNFLQAIGLAFVAFIALTIFGGSFTQSRVILIHSAGRYSFLPLVIAIPTITVALVWLAYLNYANFRDGWALWRRNLLGLAGSAAFVFVSSNLIYHRAWDVVEPAEPAHGAARLTQANPPAFLRNGYNNLLVRLPDGRVRFDALEAPWRGDSLHWWSLLRYAWDPLPKSTGPQKFLSGSDWVAAAAHHFYTGYDVRKGGVRQTVIVSGFSDSVGIESDGTLWVSGKSKPDVWTANTLTPFGNESDWQQLATSDYLTPVLLLKKDGTLWELGPPHYRPQNLRSWPGLRAFEPRRVGTNSDWTEISSRWGFQARKKDGTVWSIELSPNGQDHLKHETNFDGLPAEPGLSGYRSDHGAYVRKDGALWIYDNSESHGQAKFTPWQCGDETNWMAVAAGWEWMVALKSDGTLWKWDHSYLSHDPNVRAHAVLLSTHHDWVALTGYEDNAIALAADGSLWFWPDKDGYAYDGALMELPKQPQFLGNVFSRSH